MEPFGLIQVQCLKCVVARQLNTVAVLKPIRSSAVAIGPLECTEMEMPGVYRTWILVVKPLPVECGGLLFGRRTHLGLRAFQALIRFRFLLCLIFPSEP